MATRNYWAVFGSGAPSTYSGLAPTFITFVSSSGTNGTPPAITEPGSKGLYLFAFDASATMIAFVMDGATTGLATADRYISGVLDPYDTFGVTLNAIGSALTSQGSTLTGIGSSLIGIGGSLTSIGSTQLGNGILLTNLGTTMVAIGVTNVAIGSTQTANGILITNLGTTTVGLGSSLSGLAGFVGTTTSSFGSTSVDPTTLFGFLKRAQETVEGNEVYTKSTGVMTISSRGSSTLLASKTIADTSSQTTKT